MRVHTNTLTEADLDKALEMVKGRASFVTLITQGQHGSRSHKTAFEVALRGYGSRHTKRPQTSITSERDSEYAATYDDWGWFALGVFSLDATATVGPYKGINDFMSQTKYAYQF
jgi:hypothetical protein